MPPETEAITSDAGDIRSALAAAITEHEPIETQASKPAAKEAPELPLETKTETASEKAERERDETGKFKAKTEGKEKPEVAAKEKPEAELTESKEKPEGETEKPLAPDFQRALASWKPADQAMFKALPADSQAFMMRRYKEMTADYTKKLQDVSRIKTEYDPIDKMFEPHRDVMKQKGFTPASLVEVWANVEKKLASGEQGALEVIAGLVRGYNVTPARVAQVLGIRGGQEQQRQQPQVGADGKPVAQPQQIQLPQNIIDALQLIPQLQQTVTGLTEAQKQAREAERNAAGTRAMNEIEQFKSAVDDKGILLRPHFEDVEQDMVDLANSYIAAKKSVPPLQELYEKAVWANPSTREALRTAEKQAAEKAQADQARTKAASARKAAVSVTGAPGSGQAPQVRGQPERSLRDEIETQLAEQSAA
jgi:hypothetical protein